MGEVPGAWPESRSVRSQISPGQADIRPRKLLVLDPGNDGQIGIASGEDPEGAPYIEVLDAQGAVALDLAPHQGRDQASRDDEEYAHTGERIDVGQFSVESCGPSKVTNQDKKNRGGPQAVQ